MNKRSRTESNYAMRAISTVAMISGGLIYLLWRPADLVMFSWLSAIGLGEEISIARAFAAPLAAGLPSFVVFSLPQGLWVFSGCLAIHYIWGDWRSRGERVWLGSLVCLALGLELAQAPGWIEGVFDLIDVIWVLAALLGAGLTILLTSKPSGKETSTDEIQESERPSDVTLCASATGRPGLR